MKSHQLFLLLFLLPSFFQRIFIGGEISSYTEVSGFSFTFLGYVVHIIVILAALVDKSLFKNQAILTYVLPIMILSLFHLVLLSDFGKEAWIAGVLGIVRSLIWVIACATISYHVKAEEFLSIVMKLIDLSFIVIVISFIIYYLSGIPFQMILSGGTPRAQAFFTEPSTLAAFLAGYIALSILNGDKKRIVLGILVMFFVNSVLALFGLLVGMIFGIFSKRIIKNKLYRKFIRVNFIFLMILLFSISFFNSEISNYAREVSVFLEGGYLANTTFYHVFINRILHAAISFEDGVALVRNNQNVESGGVFRYTSMLLLLEQMNNSWYAFTGYGLGAHAQIMLSQEMSILDFGFLPLLISSFGYLIAFILLYWIAKKITSNRSQLSFFVIPFSVLAMFNSAGGIHTYSIVLVSVFILSKKHNNKYTVHRKKAANDY